MAKWFERVEGGFDPKTQKVLRTGQRHKGEKPPPPPKWKRSSENTKPPPPQGTDHHA